MRRGCRAALRARGSAAYGAAGKLKAVGGAPMNRGALHEATQQSANRRIAQQRIGLRR
jgi:hypothetical protein